MTRIILVVKTGWFEVREVDDYGNTRVLSNEPTLEGALLQARYTSPEDFVIGIARPGT